MNFVFFSLFFFLHKNLIFAYNIFKLIKNPFHISASLSDSAEYFFSPPPKRQGPCLGVTVKAHKIIDSTLLLYLALYYSY